MIVILILVAIILINIIFGYWRANTRKFSRNWFLAIHIPVPIAIGLRLSFIGWSWPLLPAFVAAFFAGQYTGSLFRSSISKKQNQLGSFLIADLIRMLPFNKRV